MPRNTPLYHAHVGAGARMVDFAGWSMPLHYGSQLAEHEAVRTACGLFDVSHMTVTDFQGAGARTLLRRLLANDVAKLDGCPGKALYSCLLNDHGGVIDDLIVYLRGDGTYRVVSNAATRDRVRPYLAEHAAAAGVALVPQDAVALIAVQGPAAVATLRAAWGDAAERAVALKPFYSVEIDGVFAGRTGYTGEDGFELIVGAADAQAWWNRLCDAGGRPCGLGARDSLRLEAGLNLNGQEMDETITPLESGLGWTVAWAPEDRGFVGRPALEAQRDAGPKHRLTGLVLEGRALPRHGCDVRTGAGEGVVTSGGHSPVLGQPIALARVPAAAQDGFHVVIRGREIAARAVRPPFVRHGKVCV